MEDVETCCFGAGLWICVGLHTLSCASRRGRQPSMFHVCPKWLTELFYPGRPCVLHGASKEGVDIVF